MKASRIRNLASIGLLLVTTLSPAWAQQPAKKADPKGPANGNAGGRAADSGATNAIPPADAPKPPVSADAPKPPTPADAPKPSSNEIKLTVANLLDKKVVGKLSSNTPLGREPLPTECVMNGSLSDDTLTVEVNFGDNCKSFLESPPKAESVVVKVGDKRFAIKLVMPATSRISPATVKVQTDKDTVSIEAPSISPDDGEALFAISSPDGWNRYAFKKEKGRFISTDPKLVAALRTAGGEKQAYTNINASGAIAGPEILFPARLTTNPTAGDSVSSDSKLPRNWCSSQGSEGPGAMYLVCLDLTPLQGGSTKRRLRVFPESNHILVPNQSLRVVVAHGVDTSLEVELGGEQGVYLPSDRKLEAPANGVRTQASGDSAALVVDYHEFAPRRPGKANLTVTLKDNSGKSEAHTVEFIVEETYLGAIRLGIGVVGGKAVDRAYETRVMRAGGPSEIVSKTKQKVDLELVLGYSAYLSARGYVTGCYPFCFQPYIGIGVLNQSDSGLETLKSLHVGLEWEPTPNFGVALTGVARRVTRLADGYKVGAAVSGDAPTETRYDIGYGVVFNLSPEFFRVAKGAGTGFYK